MTRRNFALWTGGMETGRYRYAAEKNLNNGNAYTSKLTSWEKFLEVGLQFLTETCLIVGRNKTNFCQFHLH